MVFSVSITQARSPASSHLTPKSVELSARIFPNDPVSDLSDYGLISGAWELQKECERLSARRRRAFRTELWPHCASLSPPSHYFLQRAEKNLKNQYPFQRPIEVKFYNAPANYSECVTSFFFSGRGRNAQLRVLSIR